MEAQLSHLQVGDNVSPRGIKSQPVQCPARHPGHGESPMCVRPFLFPLLWGSNCPQSQEATTDSHTGLEAWESDFLLFMLQV